MALEVAPLGPYGAERLLLALLIGDNHRFLQGCLIVHIEGNQHKVVFQFVGHTRIRPYCGFHLTAVYAAEASEVDEDRLTLCTGSGHAGIIVFVFSLDDGRVEVEVLCANRWGKGTDGLTGGTPEAGHHIDGESQRHQSPHDAQYGHGFVQLTTHLVALELQPAAEVCA